MSFFEKLKSQNSAPPTPCRRTGDREDFGWPQDEFDDDDSDNDDDVDEDDHEYGEDGDMYETPPCEPVVKQPERPVKEHVYLDKPSNPPVLPKLVIPQPRAYLPKTPQSVPLIFEANSRKPPEIDRSEKPGRRRPLFSPAAASLPQSMEEDVYIEPNSEQENSDNVYIEPSQACPLSSPGSMRMPFPPAVMSPPLSIVKPPVPRAKPKSLLLSLAEVKTVVSTLSPPVPRVRTSLAAKLRESSQSSSNPTVADTGLVASSREQNGNEDNEWFAGDINRRTAELFLLKINMDGAFLIRHSSTKSTWQPFTLAVLHQKKVYNIPIRFLEEAQGYALGKEGNMSKEVFSSLEEMISHHQKKQLLLIDSKTQATHTAYLSYPVRPDSLPSYVL